LNQLAAVEFHASHQFHSVAGVLNLTHPMIRCSQESPQIADDAEVIIETSGA
jgi:hypothetical protein